MKFGGTSVKDAARIRGLLPIIRGEDLSEGLAVVCSTMKGVTDDLINAARKAEQGDSTWETLHAAILLRHETAVKDLFHGLDNDIWTSVQTRLHDLAEILHGIYLIRECSLRSMDLVMSFGERLNNEIIAAWFRTQGFDASFVDSRPLVLTDEGYGNAAVQFTETYGRIEDYFTSLWGPVRAGKIAFITGFIGATHDGITTTLGRNGSDYTASIFGAGLNVSDIEIWTDVDGVLTCDPRIVKEAFVVEDLSVEEAMEMSYFGAEVIHPYTMIPAVDKNIPLWIKNTMNPGVRGTRIARDIPPSPHAITGLAVVKGAALINVVGGGMVGAKGTASKVFGALAKTDTNVIMISQASSEHSICVVVRESEALPAVEELRRVFEQAMKNRSIQSVDLIKDLEILSVIGANMRGRPGVSGKLFTALGSQHVNILAIAQGSSEMNISCVIESKDRNKALHAIHEAFFPEAHQ